MAYVVISNPESGKVQSALKHIQRTYGSKVLADQVLIDFIMNTRESGLAQRVDITFELMTDEQRSSWLGSADAYRIVNGEIDLTNPTYKGRKAQP